MIDKIGITVVGLGLGGKEHWTQAATSLLHEATEIFSTIALPQLNPLSAHLHRVMDSIDEGPGAMVSRLIQLAQRPGGVIYACPGNPISDDPLFPHLQQQAASHNLPLKIIPGPSLLDAMRIALQIEATLPLQISRAADLLGYHHPPLAPDQPALILHCAPPSLVQLQQVLQNGYADDFAVTFIQQAGSQNEQRWSCRVGEIGEQIGTNFYTTLYLPPDPLNSSFTTFQETIAHLRAPEGCPWDREQTHKTLRPYLLEETYEVLETLDAGDPVALAEELGDLLLQIVLHTQIAVDTGEFKMGEVIGHIQRKMIRRHPHVFADVTVDGSAQVVSNWQEIKMAEKAAKGVDTATDSVLDGIPPALPALTQALTISKRVVRVGFEWPNIEGVLDKLIEEAQEITAATDADHLESEIGDLLFSAVNLARWHNIDPESALRAMNARFTRRFKRVEQLARAEGKALPEMTLAEMEGLWQQAKQLEG